MDLGSAGRGWERPAEVYSHQLRELRGAQAIDQTRERLLGYLKVAIVLSVVVVGLLFLRSRVVLESLGAPAVVFVALAVVHEKVLRT